MQTRARLRARVRESGSRLPWLLFSSQFRTARVREKRQSRFRHRGTGDPGRENPRRHLAREAEDGGAEKPAENRSAGSISDRWVCEKRLLGLTGKRRRVNHATDSPARPW